MIKLTQFELVKTGAFYSTSLAVKIKFSSGSLNDSYYYTYPPEERDCNAYENDQRNLTLSENEIIGINLFWWVSS